MACKIQHVYVHALKHCSLATKSTEPQKLAMSRPGEQFLLLHTDNPTTIQWWRLLPFKSKQIYKTLMISEWIRATNEVYRKRWRRRETHGTVPGYSVECAPAREAVSWRPYIHHDIYLEKSHKVFIRLERRDRPNAPVDSMHSMPLRPSSMQHYKPKRQRSKKTSESSTIWRISIYNCCGVSTPSYAP